MRDDRELMKLEGAEAISQLQELANLVKYHKPSETSTAATGIRASLQLRSSTKFLLQRVVVEPTLLASHLACSLKASLLR